MEKKLFGVTEGIICQQNNCRGAYGAGLSGAISDQFPEVLQAFQHFNKVFNSPDEQLGKHQIVPLANYDGTNDIKLAVANIYTQRDYGNSAKTGVVYTNTPLLVKNIKEIAESNPDLPVYIPHAVDQNGKHGGIGCGLAGEKWENLYPQLQALNLPNLYLLDTFTGEREKVQPVSKEKSVYTLYNGKMKYEVTPSVQRVLESVAYWNHCERLDRAELREAEKPNSGYSIEEINRLSNDVKECELSIRDRMNEMERLGVPNWVGNAAMAFGRENDLRVHYMSEFFEKGKYSKAENDKRMKKQHAQELE